MTKLREVLQKEVIEENNVDVTKYPALWFSAKSFYDKSRVLDVLQFCIKWTNNLLSDEQVDSYCDRKGYGLEPNFFWVRNVV